MERRDSLGDLVTRGQRSGRVMQMWGRLVALLCVATVALVVTTSRPVIAGHAAQRSPLGDVPVLDRLIDVGGYRLHLRCMGTGSPTVVLEAASGGNLTVWAKVQPALSRDAHVCAYDRAGEGTSDPGPLPRTSRRIIGALHTLLGRAGVGGPYVLVGHSIGGLYMRLYAYTYPREVVGMVLVNSAHEDEPTPPTEFLRQMLAPPTSCPPKATECEEVLSLLTDQAEARAAVKTRGSVPLGSMPLVVLTAGDHHLGGLGAEEIKQFDTFWELLQRDFLHLSSNSVQIILPQIEHHIQTHQPFVVIGAIQEVLDAARRHGPLVE